MKRYLLTPGPVELPESVRAAAAQEMIGHRCADFSQLLNQVEDKLKNLLNVSTPVVIIPSSGTGALEALAVNFLDEGDKFASVSCGVFGNRFREIAIRCKAVPTCMDVPMGKAVSPEDVADFVKKNSECKVLMLTQNETSTGVLNPIKEIIAAIPYDNRPIILVDAVSSAGAMELYPHDWGIDGVATASQKGFLTPPGLGLVWLSQKAWSYIENRKCRSYYFDLKLHLKELQGKSPANPYTPPVSLYFALDKALDIILAEGRDKWFKSRRRYANALAAGLESLGFKLLVKETAMRSPGVTAFYAENADTEAIRAKLSQMGIDTAGGQGELKGKIIRAAHYNDFTWTDLSLFLGALYATVGVRNVDFLGNAWNKWTEEA